MSIFYVYEHWRPDLDVCFYVGKGSGHRAKNLSRNAHHRHVCDKLATLGMCVEIRLVRSGLDENEAFAIERERIAFWRRAGIRLANRTDGGEGFSGFVRPLGIKQTETAKQKLSRARMGIKFTDAHRKKLSQRKAGIKRKPFTEETIKRMRLAAARREEARRQKFGGQVRRTSRIKEPA